MLVPVLSPVRTILMVNVCIKMARNEMCSLSDVHGFKKASISLDLALLSRVTNEMKQKRESTSQPKDYTVLCRKLIRASVIKVCYCHCKSCYFFTCYGGRCRNLFKSH